MSTGKLPEKTKGAKDEWEALALIVSGDPSLKSRVMGKIRQLREIKRNDEKKMKKLMSEKVKK